MTTTLAMLLLGVGVFSACGESSYEREQKRKTAEKEKIRHAEALRAAVVAELKRVYNADDTWTQHRFYWTLDVQTHLMPAGRPIVGVARLVDVEQRGESTLVRLQAGRQTPTIDFALRCPPPERPPDDARSWVSSLSFLLRPEYAFVAKIDGVRRASATFSDTPYADAQGVVVY